MLNNILNFEIFIRGGVMMAPLSIMAIVALAITIDKLWFIKKFTKLPKAITHNLEANHLELDSLNNFAQRLPINHCYKDFLLCLKKYQKNQINILENSLIYQAKKFEKKFNNNLWILETIITCAPLLGLLGTIFGMSRAFKIIGENAINSTQGITAGVAESLIATAFGLIIAVWALFAYNYFSKIQSQILDDMEILGAKIIDSLRSH